MVDNINPNELGKRLKLARESAKVTQAEAAKCIDVARTTLVAIEKGERKARIEELQTLSHHYRVSVNSLLRRESIHVDLIPRFRRLSETSDPDIHEAANLLNNLVRAEVELENLLGIKHNKNYPQELQILPGNVIEQARKDAIRMRRFLGLGLGPITDIFGLLELEIGIRVFQRRLPPKISGLFVYDSTTGASILINANHRYERRVQTAAHEFAHFISTRHAPEVLEENEKFLSREEKYANAFGREFLTPSDTVKRMFEKITAGSSHLTRRHVILLANYFKISREALVRGLEELKLARKGTWDWFKENGGITHSDMIKVLGNDLDQSDPIKNEANKPLSLRLGLMALQAWKRELLTEGQLSDLLKLDRITLREYLYDLEYDESEANELLKLPPK